MYKPLCEIDIEFVTQSDTLSFFDKISDTDKILRKFECVQDMC